ncbi:MAG TPA: ABC transporter ATP-binding protein [Thermoanaerobaculia bacterium]|jgi:iron complex transport system ATP-binding protein|nr:ABC transporter ATP-binding protein [Thermoanaerobaculia bacterium]
MIRFENVSFSYRETEPVLSGVHLEIPPGLTLLLGRNGCGKSTLLKMAAGVERPDHGRVEVDGRDLWVDEEEARRTLAYVPEQPDLTPYATVREILGLVCRLRVEPGSAADTALTLVGLDNLAHRSVRELSMGQRRRAVLAAARIGAPSHLLLDEPLEAMDRGAREDILAWIDSRLDHGASVVVVSHDIAPFAARADRAITVKDGRCVSPGELPRDPAERMNLLERLARSLD